jgi:hypothetical protein
MFQEHQQLIEKEDELRDQSGDIIWKYLKTSFLVENVADEIGEFLTHVEHSRPEAMQHPGVCLLRTYFNGADASIRQAKDLLESHFPNCISQLYTNVGNPQ